MRKVWFTADTHFGHGNIIKFCGRPFLSDAEFEKLKSDPRGPWKISNESVKNHDDSILEAINSRVQKTDDLWILGDFCWGKLKEAENFRSRICCKNVYLVWGNHDHRSIKSVFQKTIEQGMISAEGQKIWLNHYPMRTWDKRFHGSWHLYGHVHDRLSKEDAETPTLLVKDVGVDACDYRPIDFEELSAYMEPRIKAFEELKQREAPV